MPLRLRRNASARRLVIRRQPALETVWVSLQAHCSQPWGTEPSPRPCFQLPSLVVARGGQLNWGTATSQWCWFLRVKRLLVDSPAPFCFFTKSSFLKTTPVTAQLTSGKSLPGREGGLWPEEQTLAFLPRLDGGGAGRGLLGCSLK